MNKKILVVIFNSVTLFPSQIPKLRGFFSNKFPEDTEFHNHLPDGSFSYKFPQIQYRIINKHPALIGIENGIEILKRLFFSLDEIIIDNRVYNLHEKEITLKAVKIGISDEFINYRFSSPWMALNESNYLKYNDKNKFEKQQFLKHILRENLKTLSKGFDYWIQEIEEIKVEGYFKPRQVNFKNRKMLCFSGDFTTNFHIPEFLGLGKQSARGFGVVEYVR
ncbi:MAG: hypothetical protein K9N09_03285 [Candidatus Cloacimonetes bacterium]|nr:hypothetical protein [Candidatus Cloacimonadota bacterium]MCF7815172.1 hypothetical protein [Candidatus Cloacimonadota bacterium]MCF7867700.1 hypothetical protein [Candidatus Cloacimonadota bacterium]